MRTDSPNEPETVPAPADKDRTDLEVYALERGELYLRQLRGERGVYHYADPSLSAPALKPLCRDTPLCTDRGPVERVTLPRPPERVCTHCAQRRRFGPTVHRTVRLPIELAARVEREAKAAGETWTAMITQLVQRGLGGR